jgi:hypothetical protein
MTWERIKKIIYRRRDETQERREEWARAHQYDERVRIVETDMKAITAFVGNLPSLRHFPPPSHE